MLSILDPGQLYFPAVDEADESGLLALGGDLSKERLLLAYRMGIFPWYGQDEPICWWSPDPRCILFPNELKISKSMRPLLNRGAFRFSTNTNFKDVIQNCRKVGRRGQEGTWITDEIIDAFTSLHLSGHAHSAEAWLEGKLVGGLYGIKIGKVFFGESMFSTVSNASKYVFIKYIHQLKKEGVALIDCQVYNPHLKTLGARLLPRTEFTSMLRNLL